MQQPMTAALGRQQQGCVIGARPQAMTGHAYDWLERRGASQSGRATSSANAAELTDGELSALKPAATTRSARVPQALLDSRSAAWEQVTDRRRR
jgi:hypothetical protein